MIDYLAKEKLNNCGLKALLLKEEWVRNVKKKKCIITHVRYVSNEGRKIPNEVSFHFNNDE